MVQRDARNRNINSRHTHNNYLLLLFVLTWQKRMSECCELGLKYRSLTLLNARFEIVGYFFKKKFLDFLLWIIFINIFQPLINNQLFITLHTIFCLLNRPKSKITKINRKHVIESTQCM